MNALVVSILALLVAILSLWQAICDRRQSAAKLRSLEREVAEARRAMRQRGELASEIAHEIKNPIAAIVSSADTLDLIAGDSLDAAGHRTLRYIKEYGNHLLRLVGDFIDISRAEAGKLQAHPQATDVLPIVDSIIGLLESNALRKHISLRRYVVARGPLVWVDPRHCKQIVFNLVHNAIKFTPEAGEVQIVIKSGFPRQELLIEVHDNGCGIPESELERIFDPYVRYEQGRSGDETGSGLGLALCKAMVELAGGSLRVSSQVNVGSSFEISLPLSEKQDIAAKPAETRIIELDEEKSLVEMTAPEDIKRAH